MVRNISKVCTLSISYARDMFRRVNWRWAPGARRARSPLCRNLRDSSQTWWMESEGGGGLGESSAGRSEGNIQSRKRKRSSWVDWERM